MKQRQMGLGLVFGMLCLMTTTVASTETTLHSVGAGGFEILEGQGVEICDACYKALNGLENLAVGSGGVDLSGCERNYDPLLGFSDVAWRELQPLSNLPLLRREYMLLFPVNSTLMEGKGLSMLEGTIYDGDNFKREIMHQMKKQGGLELSSTMIDIDNDGRLDHVLKLRIGACINHSDPSHAHDQALIVLNQDGKTINRRKTDLVAQNPSKTKDQPMGTHWDSLYSAFQYGGRIYFDKWEWEGGVSIPETFSVYQAVGNVVTSICKYRYHRGHRFQNHGGIQ